MMIGEVNQANTDKHGLVNYAPSMSIFALFGIISILLSLLLLRLDKAKGYKLEEKNIK